mgnify:CR=1 FL=1
MYTEPSLDRFTTSSVAAMVDLMVSRIGPKWSNSNSNDAIGPIHDNKRFTEVATGIGKMKNAKSKPYS